MSTADGIFIWFMFFLTFLAIYHTDSKNLKMHAETQALILEYQSKLTAVETEKQKTIADFLRSVKTGRENR